VWEYFLVEVWSPPTIAICIAIYKMPACQFIKQVHIHTNTIWESPKLRTSVEIVTKFARL
jgi:hypothetical protein